jgi:hypothetical protein
MLLPGKIYRLFSGAPVLPVAQGAAAPALVRGTSEADVSRPYQASPRRDPRFAYWLHAYEVSVHTKLELALAQALALHTLLHKLFNAGQAQPVFSAATLQGFAEAAVPEGHDLSALSLLIQRLHAAPDYRNPATRFDMGQRLCAMVQEMTRTPNLLSFYNDMALQGLKMGGEHLALVFDDLELNVRLQRIGRERHPEHKEQQLLEVCVGMHRREVLEQHTIALKKTKAGVAVAALEVGLRNAIRAHRSSLGDAVDGAEFFSGINAGDFVRAQRVLQAADAHTPEAHQNRRQFLGRLRPWRQHLHATYPAAFEAALCLFGQQDQPPEAWPPACQVAMKDVADHLTESALDRHGWTAAPAS